MLRKGWISLEESVGDVSKNGREKTSVIIFSIKAMRTLAKNCQNQLFSELWKLIKDLWQSEKSLFKKKAESQKEQQAL